MTTALRLSALIGALALAASASATTIFYNFDGASAGTLATTFDTADFSFHNGLYDTLKDGDNLPIPGSDQWQIDTASDTSYPVIVDNPFNSTTHPDYGVAPSGSYALQVIDQTVLIQFAYDVDVQSFTVTLDNSTLGNLTPTSIDFVNGATVAYSQSIDQTTSGLVVNVGAVSGVRTIVLPTSAYYDNLGFTFSASAVPEPSTYASLAGLAGLAFAIVRRRRAA